MNDSKEMTSTDNKLSARSKVMDSWQSGWDSISKSPNLPVVDMSQMSHSLKTNKSDKNVFKNLNKSFDPTKVITKENNIKSLAKQKKTKSILRKDKSKDNPKAISMDTSIDNSEDNSKDISKTDTKDKSIDTSKDSSKEGSNELSDKLNVTSSLSQSLAMADIQMSITLKANKNVCKNNKRFDSKKVITKYRELKSKNIKIKRNRKRPLIIKNLTQSKSFQDFISQRFSIKEGVPFIQDRSCKELTKNYESSQLNHCLDCNEKKSQSQTCRFLWYRTVIKNGDQLSVYAFAEEGNATHDDCKIWLPMEKALNLDEKTATYLLVFVGREFCRIYKEEQRIANPSLPVTWKKPVKGIRELCDICETTIFNTHYVCPNCGLAVCIDCFCRRSSLSQTTVPIRHNTRHRNHDEFGWILCKDKQIHDLNAFHLAVFITQAVFGSIDKTYHDIRNHLQIHGSCDCKRLDSELDIDMREISAQLDLKHYQSQVPRQWLCEDRLLILTDPKCDDNLKLFQIYWQKGFPVIIEKVNQTLDYKLWTPQSFKTSFGKHLSRLVNCMDGQILPKQPMNNFWDGFENIEQRLYDTATNEVMILKLKDWPPDAEFRDVLPLWYDNLMDALPLPEYTRYNGSRNLASRLPEFFVRPDLGPKMYCAYGSVLHPDKGTTNLHLDMSDAVNVMIYVGVAKQEGKPLQSHLDSADSTLLKGGCDRDMMSRAKNAGQKVGALWHIWKAEDADKIRLFLNKVAKERNIKIESNNDPIHDQSWYLDETLRTRLEIEYNVKGLAIAQCLGDAILVPAGAPHQVQNIHSCIKVAGEFVSPENVFHCLAMTQQFRHLSKRHNNHEDKLQIKNIIYHTIKDALSVLLPPVPYNSCNFAIPAPPKLMSERPMSANSMTVELPNLQPKSDFNEEIHSLDAKLEIISSDNQTDCQTIQTSIENSTTTPSTGDTSSLSHSTCVANGFVDHKTTDSVVMETNICLESQSSESKSMQVCEDSTQSSETYLPPPPVLTPFSYCDEPISDTGLSTTCP